MNALVYVDIGRQGDSLGEKIKLYEMKNEKTSYDKNMANFETFLSQNLQFYHL